MRIYKFFIISLLMLLLEMVLLDVWAHPTLSFVKICALSALVVQQMPWYAQAYLLMIVSISSALQGFPFIFDLVGFGMLIILSSLFRTVIIKNILLQSVIVIVFTLLFTGIDCWSCLTIRNICATILITPFMIKFLR